MTTAPPRLPPKPFPESAQAYEATCAMCGHLAYKDRMKVKNKQRLCLTCFGVVQQRRRERSPKPVPNKHALAGEAAKKAAK